MNGYEFKTVFKEAESQLIEKKSKFIAYVKPINIEEEAINFINQIRSKHFDATHNVYAYVLKDNNIQRYSDDGEPSGTAGIPVLEAIKTNNLTNVVVVVTRYFGGTLLGTGGLIRAYGASARLGLEESQPISMILCDIYNVECDYTILGRLQYDIEEHYIIENIEYTDSVNICALVNKGQNDNFKNLVTESSLGRAIVNKIGEKYIGVKE